MYRTSVSYMQIGFLYVQKDTFGKNLEIFFHKIQEVAIQAVLWPKF